MQSDWVARSDVVVYRFEWTVSDGLVMFVVLPGACQSSVLHVFFLSGFPASPKEKCALLNMIQPLRYGKVGRQEDWEGGRY